MISIDSVGIFAYEYSITVNGKTYQKFREEQKKSLKLWQFKVAEKETRVCLGKNNYILKVCVKVKIRTFDNRNT